MKTREFTKRGDSGKNGKPQKYVRCESGELWICDSDVVNDGNLESKGCRRAPEQFAD